MRIEKQHPLYPTLETKHFFREAGIAGEERVAEVLRNYSFTFEHRILHDVSLVASTIFQIDSLFLTRRYAFILEVKNISGRLKFSNQSPQLIRTRADGQVDGFDCPAAQLERNVELFQEWLLMHGFHLPVFGVVVLAYPKQIVELAPARTKILFPSNIPSYIRNLPPYPNKLDAEKLDFLTAEILRSHQRFIPTPLCQTYSIYKNEIQTGVKCNLCNMLGMEKFKKGWYCKRCKHHDKMAHKEAIKDWFLLFGDKMRNKDCREFLHIDNPQTATRLLQSMNLQSEGSYRDRSYSMIFQVNSLHFFTNGSKSLIIGSIVATIGSKPSRIGNNHATIGSKSQQPR
nr:nuclease-related domain-containing protein [Bacillus sp. FJAT-50079]